jgi:hypothetical protein
LTPRASDVRYATVQVLSAEARILDMAARWRRGGQGQVPLTAPMPRGRDGRLDPSQYGAVLQLAGGGDFLTVLTAPAGAGRTSTLGAAARAWQDAGYRVVGLAPSARAAAGLATATGEAADTLAKWLHTHRGTPAVRTARFCPLPVSGVPVVGRVSETRQDRRDSLQRLLYQRGLSRLLPAARQRDADAAPCARPRMRAADEEE